MVYSAELGYDPDEWEECEESDKFMVFSPLMRIILSVAAITFTYFFFQIIEKHNKGDKEEKEEKEKVSTGESVFSVQGITNLAQSLFPPSETFESGREAARDALGHLPESVSSAAGNLMGGMQEKYEEAKKIAQQTSQAVSGYTHDGMQGVQRAFEDGKEKAREVADSATHFMHQPVEQLQHLGHQAADYAKQPVEQIKQLGQQGMEYAKQPVEQLQHLGQQGMEYAAQVPGQVSDLATRATAQLPESMPQFRSREEEDALREWEKELSRIEADRVAKLEDREVGGSMSLSTDSRAIDNLLPADHISMDALNDSYPDNRPFKTSQPSSKLDEIQHGLEKKLMSEIGQLASREDVLQTPDWSRQSYQAPSDSEFEKSEDYRGQFGAEASTTPTKDLHFVHPQATVPPSAGVIGQPRQSNDSDDFVKVTADQIRTTPPQKERTISPEEAEQLRALINEYDMGTDIVGQNGARPGQQPQTGPFGTPIQDRQPFREAPGKGVQGQQSADEHSQYSQDIPINFVDVQHPQQPQQRQEDIFQKQHQQQQQQYQQQPFGQAPTQPQAQRYEQQQHPQAPQQYGAPQGLHQQQPFGGPQEVQPQQYSTQQQQGVQQQQYGIPPNDAPSSRAEQQRLLQEQVPASSFQPPVHHVEIGFTPGAPQQQQQQHQQGYRPDDSRNLVEAEMYVDDAIEYLNNEKQKQQHQQAHPKTSPNVSGFVMEEEMLSSHGPDRQKNVPLRLPSAGGDATSQLIRTNEVFDKMEHDDHDDMTYAPEIQSLEIPPDQMSEASENFQEYFDKIAAEGQNLGGQFDTIRAHPSQSSSKAIHQSASPEHGQAPGFAPLRPPRQGEAPRLHSPTGRPRSTNSTSSMGKSTGMSSDGYPRLRKQSSLLSIMGVTSLQELLLSVNSLEALSDAMAKAGLESTNLVFGIDYTASNKYQGEDSFGGRSLHTIHPNIKNPYQQVITILGRTLAPFASRNTIPVFGFGDAKTSDWSVFPLKPDGECAGLEEVLKVYNEVTPTVDLSGPTNFAPLIYQAIEVCQKIQDYHILVIIADGQVTNEKATRRAIVQACQYPLSIIVVGVGDGPWDMMRVFDESLPKRSWDNFHFVEFHEIMKCNEGPDADVKMAVHSLLEIPDQYRCICEMGLVKRRTPQGSDQKLSQNY